MSYTKLIYHIVFSTKDRRPFLTDDLKPRLGEYLGGIARELEGVLLDMGGVPDHIHLLSGIHPTLAVADFLENIKAGSSKWIHRTLPKLKAFAWQEGYSAFTVSPSMAPKVKRYIAAQAEHHKKVAFEEELIALLNKHGIEYDPRYVGR